MANAFGVTDLDAHSENDEVMYENSDSDVNMEEEKKEDVSSSSTIEPSSTSNNNGYTGQILHHYEGK